MVRTKVTLYTYATEYPNQFRIDDGILFCIYYNHAIKWKKKSTIDNHVYDSVHYAKKKLYESKKASGNTSQQMTIALTISAANKKKELIEDLIYAFATSDIPLEKVNSLLLFFQKHLK